MLEDVVEKLVGERSEAVNLIIHCEVCVKLLNGGIRVSERRTCESQ